MSWKTKHSTVIATSSTEAELISAAYCAAEVAFLRKLAQELGFVQVSPTIIFEDNNGAIALGNSGHFKGRSNIGTAPRPWPVFQRHRPVLYGETTS